jgi:uncharacterized membrane protein
MSDQAAPIPRRRMGLAGRALIATAVTVAIIGVSLGPAGFQAVARRFGEGRFHAPRLELIAQAPLTIQLHLLTVLGSLLIGVVQMLGVKGARLHRILGWSFVVLMLATAVDALFIYDPAGPRFTPLHLFSLLVLVSAPLGVLAARRHKVAVHRRAMTGLFFGGLILAGLFAFMPGRLMWRVFFG